MDSSSDVKAHWDLPNRLRITWRVVCSTCKLDALGSCPLPYSTTISTCPRIFTITYFTTAHDKEHPAGTPESVQCGRLRKTTSSPNASISSIRYAYLIGYKCYANQRVCGRKRSKKTPEVVAYAELYVVEGCWQMACIGSDVRSDP
ncbi:hypothetical protein PAXINDRAFT_21506 [Paxillus involutus ATCC 200175]|uniref:Uncharacterized protein n=1 Tax=Paxillus involutus ATCC 200175 TaxID=664439 RepID=A0A0C9SLY1_PAXIN|nr:hypothetical protein PAXINDRAFT_21506 [Paxillus involutus ATCC 200175]